MRRSDGSRRPWRRTVDQSPPEPIAPTSHATSSQTVMVIASAIGVSSALVPMELRAIARHLVPSVVMVAPISNRTAGTAAAMLGERHIALAQMVAFRSA